MRGLKDRRKTWRAAAVAVALVAGLFASSWAGDGVYSTGKFELGDGNPPPGFPAAADILLNGDQAGPDWEEIFDANGVARPDVIASYGGQWAVFVADDVSLGSGFESTAIAVPGASVENGVVSADDDIGNAYVYTTFDSEGNLLVYGGVERLGGGDSYVEFELNQVKYRLGRGGYGIGLPWAIDGRRTSGDVVARITFAGGAVSSMSVSGWQDGGWQPLAQVAGEGCAPDELACVIANGSVIDGGPWQSFDPAAEPGEISVNRFAEFGFNLGALVGFQPAFVTVQIRTPQDIAFGYFGEGR